jgi:anthranilate synthase / indole-3-glycerol phosphate synthase / phosphoribosylanthranilate isomerase
LAAIIPEGKDVVLCASSGISTWVDVERYLRDNAGAVLVREALMRTEIPPRSSLICSISPPRRKEDTNTTTTVHKDLRDKDGGRSDLVCRRWCYFIGFVFVPGSKRAVSVDDARRIQSILDPDRPSLPLNQTEIGMGMAPWFTTHTRSIDRERRSRPPLMGVFENATVEMVREVVWRVPLDVVQLHGRN